jgi:hypothetical protein
LITTTNGVALTWNDGLVSKAVAYRVYRGESDDFGKATVVSTADIPAGGPHRFEDSHPTALAYYWIELTDRAGAVHDLGPFLLSNPPNHQYLYLPFLGN